MSSQHSAHGASSAARGLAAEDQWPDPAAGALDRVVDAERRRAAMEAEQARLMDQVVELRRSEASRAAGGRAAGNIAAGFAVDELAAALAWTRRRVEARLASVRFVHHHLPQVWSGWQAGLVDAYRVDVVVGAARLLVDPDHVRQLDDAVTAIMGECTGGQLRRWCARFLARVEPGEAERRHTIAFTDRMAATAQGEDGMGSLWLTTNAVDLAALDQRLTALARGLGADDPRTVDQRRSDLATDLLLGRAGAGTLRAGSPEAGRRRPVDDRTTGIRLVVTIPWTSLLGADDAPGHLVDGTPLPASVVRALADAPGTVFHRLLTDARGQVLDVSQLGRFPDPPLRLATQIRDGTCMFPTCSTPAERCDCDHTVAHPDGPTCWCNLACLCRRHHRLKQHRGVSLEQLSPGLLRWTLPSGRTYLVCSDPAAEPAVPSAGEAGLCALLALAA